MVKDKWKSKLQGTVLEVWH